MWIFMNDSFLSIVAHRDRPEWLLVRARRAGDIEAVFPDFAVREDPHADYRFRTAVPRKWAGDTLAYAVRGIDYNNFKHSVSDLSRHRAYLDVWRTMWEWTQEF